MYVIDTLELWLAVWHATRVDTLTAFHVSSSRMVVAEAASAESLKRNIHKIIIKQGYDQQIFGLAFEYFTIVM